MTFIGLAVLINIAASLAARNRATQIAASFDMTVTVTAIYYWLLVRPGLRRPATLIWIAAPGLLRASFAFPHLIPGKEFLAAGAECALLGILVAGFRKRPGAPDPVEKFRAALAGILPFETAERALAGELAVLYYAFAWRARTHVPSDAASFTVHHRSGFGDKILLIGVAALFEILPAHILIYRKSPAAAWVVTGIGLYGAIWLLALTRSLALRPCFVSYGLAGIRLGLFCTLLVPAQAIARVGSKSKPGALTLPRGSAPNVCLEFTAPLEAELLFGIRRRVTAVNLTADDPEALISALRRMAY